MPFMIPIVASSIYRRSKMSFRILDLPNSKRMELGCLGSPELLQATLDMNAVKDG